MKRNIKALKRLEGDLIVEEGEDDELINQNLYFNIMFVGIGC